MVTEQKNSMSVLDIFAKTQETFEEAKKKSNEESGNKAKYFRITQDGTVAVRILPLAPVIDENGDILPMDRKGYEYPVKELVLKINDTVKDAKGKQKVHYVNVCNVKYAYPNLENDLIDMYVATACELYADDEALCKKLKESSFNGGLKWDYKRCFYIFDADKRADGIQIMQLSYSQYKDLEERKMKLWNKLMKNGKVPCPISSIENAYPLEITRSTEKKKTQYSFNIDTVSGVDELSEDELKALLDAPRLPEVLYRYSKFHLEATIAFLTQLDKEKGIEVMKEEAVQNCIAQIKMSLPADDQSSFKLGGSDANSAAATENTGIEALWATFDQLENEGLDDRSEEGQNLRTSIKEFIEENGMNVRVARGKSNLDLLNEIQDILDDDDLPQGSAKEEEDAPATDPEPEDPEPEEPEDDEPATSPTPATRRSRNDDTNEPAARPDRRAARPARRR